MKAIQFDGIDWMIDGATATGETRDGVGVVERLDVDGEIRYRITWTPRDGSEPLWEVRRARFYPPVERDQEWMVAWAMFWDRMRRVRGET